MPAATATNSRAVVERYVAAVGAGDLDTIRASFAREATWTLRGDLPLAGVWKGRDAIVDDFLLGAIGYYEEGSVTIDVTKVIANGDDVVVEWTTRARTATGAPYENQCIGVFAVRDGEITAVREYMDTSYAARVAFGR